MRLTITAGVRYSYVQSPKEARNAFSGFAVDDIAAAREFYAETLGLNTSEPMEDVLLSLDHPGGRSTVAHAGRTTERREDDAGRRATGR
mgnify:CR=1 FL=1